MMAAVRRMVLIIVHFGGAQYALGHRHARQQDGIFEYDRKLN